MKMPNEIDADRIAPCGVNCIACGAHLDKKKPCPGCRAPAQAQLRKSCQNCAKKACCFEKGHLWCFECARFPCARIKSLNKNYQQNYGVDLVRNGIDAAADMDAFLLAQKQRFTCGHCGGVVDQHRRTCSDCGAQADEKAGCREEA